MVDHLLRLFPRLKPTAFQVTSPRDRTYNCIAWAAGDTNNWWWPIPDNGRYFWPSGVARQETLDAFREMFATLGYAPCVSDALESGFERVALFADDQAIPTHASRELPSGRWTSKLDFLEDIEHDLCDLEGDSYGVVALILRRPLHGTASPTASPG